MRVSPASVSALIAATSSTLQEQVENLKLREVSYDSPNCGIAQLFDVAALTSNDSGKYNALHEARISVHLFS